MRSWLAWDLPVVVCVLLGAGLAPPGRAQLLVALLIAGVNLLGYAEGLQRPRSAQVATAAAWRRMRWQWHRLWLDSLDSDAFREEPPEWWR